MDLDLSLGATAASSKEFVRLEGLDLGLRFGGGNRQGGVPAPARRGGHRKREGKEPAAVMEDSPNPSMIQLSLRHQLLPPVLHRDGMEVSSRGFDVNAAPEPETEGEEEEEAATAGAGCSSPNSAASAGALRRATRALDGGDINNQLRTSDEEDNNNGFSRKKLRLTKEQAAFLEESFKEHNTLTPKQKLALAEQLKLRPRQVEVWFQNRRARTKLKQMEVDCEYLKRCCEALTQENSRLQKEVSDLRALKSAAVAHPFCMQLPATTLSMCPSCERTTKSPATTTTAASNERRPPPSFLQNNCFPPITVQSSAAN